MNKIKITLLTLCLMFSFKTQSQVKGSDIATIGVGIAAIGSAIAMNSKMKEMAELKATEWFLTAHPEYSNFSLKTLDFDAKKAKDASNVSVVTYKIQLFTPDKKTILNGKRFVLFAYLSDGWVNQYGMDFSKFMWHLVDQKEWLNMMTAYAKVSSPEKNEGTILKTLKEGKIVNRGVTVRNKMIIPFYNLEEDMYLVSDYSDIMKILYNERSLGVYLKRTRNLVQIGRGDIIKIHDFLLND